MKFYLDYLPQYYENIEKYFLPNSEKTILAFTDGELEDTPDNFCENFTYDYDYRILSKTEHYVTYTAGKFRVASQIYEYEEPWVTSINYNSPYTQILHQTADVINKKLRLIKD